MQRSGRQDTTGLRRQGTPHGELRTDNSAGKPDRLQSFGTLRTTNFAKERGPDTTMERLLHNLQPAPRSLFLVLVCLCGQADSARASEPTGTGLEACLSHRARVKLDFAHRERSQPVRIVLPPELQALARPDLGDLRLLATAAGQVPQPIPFRLALPRDQETVEEYATEWQSLPATATGSRWAVSAGDPPPPVNSLVLQLDDSHRNARHTVRVWGGDSPEGSDWTLLTDHGLWLDLSQPGRRKTISRIPIPSSRYRWYRVELTGPAEAPPPVQQIRLLHLTEERAPHHEFPAPIHGTSLDRETGALTITCAVPQVGLPLQAVHLEMAASADYLVTARVSVSTSAEKPGPAVGTGELYQLSAGGPAQRESTVKCRGTTAGWLQIVLETEPGVPLEVTEVTTIVSERGVVFDPEDLPTRPDEHLAIYAGNSTLERPADSQPPLDRPDEWRSLPTALVESPIPNPAFRSQSEPANDTPRGPQGVDRRFLWFTGATLGLAAWGVVRFLWRRQLRAAARSGDLSGDKH